MFGPLQRKMIYSREFKSAHREKDRSSFQCKEKIKLIVHTTGYSPLESLCIHVFLSFVPETQYTTKTMIIQPYNAVKISRVKTFQTCQILR